MGSFQNFVFSNFCKDLKKEFDELKDYKAKIETLENNQAAGVINLDNLINQKKITLEGLRNEEKELMSKTMSINAQIHELERDLDLLNELEFFSEFGLYQPKFGFTSSLKYKEALDRVREQQKEMIKNKTAMICTTEWLVGNSKAEGKKMTNNTIKIGLKSFNSDCDLFIAKCKYNNFERMEEKIIKSFEKINELNKVNTTYITEDYLKLKLKELNLAYEYESKKQEEKEILREEKEKAREEAKLKKEIENKTAKINKDIKHYNNALEVLKEKILIETDVNLKEEIQKQITEIENSIDNLNDEIQELDYRLENIGAGYVYIISNIGSFGKNIFKIGVTRRLDPLERIDELSSASVPFKFEVNALIFDHNAYALEKYLHNKFDKYRVNLANNRKEFFELTLEMIENELKNYGGLTFEFNKETESQEYFETLKIREKLK